MPVCEGCSRDFSQGHINVHRGACQPYLKWSKCLPFKCACGRGFGAERSLRSHKKGCYQAVAISPGGRTCACGQTYWSVTEHRKTCTGVPEVVLRGVHDPGEWGCPCGKDYTHSQSRSALHKHRQGCSFWHAYQKTLLVRCEGCDLGFRDERSKGSHAQVCPSWQAWRLNRDQAEKVVPCPSCGEMMRGPQLGLHVNTCKGAWGAADWERHRQQSQNKRTALRNPDLDLGQDFVICSLCGDRFRALSVHLKTKHNMSVETYRYKLGGQAASTRTLSQRAASMVESYGAPTPLQNPDISKRAEAKRKVTCQVRYGADSYLTSGQAEPPKKNRLEARVEMLSPSNVVYVGDFRYWIQCKDVAGRWINRNPDFVVYTEDQLALVGAGVEPNKVRTGRIVEVLGDYFHGPKAKGMDRDAYVAMRLAEYATVKVECLIIWESEVTAKGADLETVRERIRAFIG